jgi:hypothetical protein
MARWTRRALGGPDGCNASTDRASDRPVLLRWFLVAGVAGVPAADTSSYIT